MKLRAKEDILFKFGDPNDDVYLLEGTECLAKEEKGNDGAYWICVDVAQGRVSKMRKKQTFELFELIEVVERKKPITPF